jgi:hypothetical protein
MRSALDGKLLEYYVLAEVPKEQLRGDGASFEALARCAIDLNDYKRGVIRAERINDVFRMLGVRHEIHEKAVYHRVVQSAIAMLARALLLADTKRPKVASLYNVGHANHCLSGDDYLLQLLVAIPDDETAHGRAYRGLAQKLIERRVYRPLMIVPGDEAHELLLGAMRSGHRSDEEWQENLRLLGAVLDSTYFSKFFCFICWCVERLLDHSLESVHALNEFVRKETKGDELAWRETVVPRRVLLWATPYKQLYKDPALVVRAGECLGRIDELVQDKEAGKKLSRSVRARLNAALDDSATRYAAMWKIYVFASDGLFYTGGLARLLSEHPCRESADAHKAHLNEAKNCIVRAIQVAWTWWSRVGMRPGADLNNEMPSAEFNNLLMQFATHPEALDGPTSAVDFEQYLHLHTNDEKCRDVRYRFDKRSSLNLYAKDDDMPVVDAKDISAVLKWADVKEGEIGHEELIDLVSHLRNVNEGVLGPGALQRASTEGHLPDHAALRREWFEAEYHSAHHISRDGFSLRPPEVPGTDRNSKSAGGRISRQSARDRGTNRPKSADGAGQGTVVDAADSFISRGSGLPDFAETPNRAKDPQGKP